MINSTNSTTNSTSGPTPIESIKEKLNHPLPPDIMPNLRVDTVNAKKEGKWIPSLLLQQQEMSLAPLPP